MTERRPIGLLGGTFDPIHNGHLRLAEEAAEGLGLAGVRLIPAGQPPHRDAPATSPHHRLAMAVLAAAANPLLDVDPAEVASPRPSYTIDTLERLRRELGAEQPLVLILGADAFAGLTSWHRWRELFAFAHVAIANRPGHAPHERRWPAALDPALDEACTPRLTRDAAALAAAPAGCVMPFEMTPLAISATRIRALLAGAHSARYLLPDEVLDYIGKHSLYR
ncbi:MAG: nicotinate-nucleotide adenylyltransferase [Rhodocyclaceae bacterium]|nr:nicotinate-nucleotide adenylyltransferase [Rhodocyclaceae bacterium]